MKFANEYKRIRDNYRSLTSIEKFIVWTRFKITPIDKLLELIPDRGKLLDLGCGFGTFSYFFAWQYPDIEIIGIDPSRDRINVAKNVVLKPGNLNFYQGEVSDLAEKDFDVVLLIDVIYLLSEKELFRALTTCYTKTKKGGTLIIKTLNRAHFFRYLFSISGSILINAVASISHSLPEKTQPIATKMFGSRNKISRYYYPEELKTILKKAGWQQAEVYDLPLKYFYYPNVIYFCRK